MPNSPRQGDVNSIDNDLGQYAEKYLQEVEGFIGMRAGPRTPVGTSSGKYYTFPKEDLLFNQVKQRAEATESAGAGYSLSTDSFVCERFALHSDVGDQTIADAAAQNRGLNPVMDATDYLMQQMLQHQEQQFASKVMTASVWTNSGNNVTATNTWDSANGTPFKDIREAIRNVKQSTGRRPNTLIMTYDVMDALLESPAVIDRVKGGSTRDNPAVADEALISAMTGIPNVYVLQAIQVTAKKGASSRSPTFIGGTGGVLLAYAPQDIGMATPTAYRWFVWDRFQTGNGPTMRRFFMENLLAERVETEMYYDLRVTSLDLGAWISNTV